MFGFVRLSNWHRGRRHGRSPGAQVLTTESVTQVAVVGGQTNWSRDGRLQVAEQRAGQSRYTVLYRDGRERPFWSIATGSLILRLRRAPGRVIDAEMEIRGCWA